MRRTSRLRGRSYLFAKVSENDRWGWIKKGTRDPPNAPRLPACRLDHKTEPPVHNNKVICLRQTSASGPARPPGKRERGYIHDARGTPRVGGSSKKSIREQSPTSRWRARQITVARTSVPPATIVGRDWRR